MADLFTALSRGEPSGTQSAVLWPFQQYGGAYSFGAWQKVTQSLCLPYMVGSFLFQVWFHLMTWSTLNLVGVKLGDSGVVIRYQVDEFT